MATDAETIVDLEHRLATANAGWRTEQHRNDELLRENVSLKASASGEKFGAPLWRGVVYVWREHKTDLIGIAMGAAALYTAYTKEAPPPDPAVIQKAADKAVEARPPVIVVPVKSEPAAKMEADTVKGANK